jgi:hypothetical protein
MVLSFDFMTFCIRNISFGYLLFFFEKYVGIKGRMIAYLELFQFFGVQFQFGNSTLCFIGWSQHPCLPAEKIFYSIPGIEKKFNSQECYSVSAPSSPLP